MVSDIGNRLKRLRKNKKFSLRALGKAAHVSHSFIADIEAGRSKPSLDTLMALARALGVSISDITGDVYLVAESPSPYVCETKAAHRTDDPMADLPEEARRSLEEFKEYILKKYGKK
jgi:transcriptional regulator with XRE-family HTH domain